MTAGTGKARRILRAIPLVILDIVATGIAFIAAAWGTGVFGQILAVGHFAAIVGVIAVTNVIVFALGNLYNSLWEYASVDELIRVVVVVTIASVVSDVLAALVFGTFNVVRLAEEHKRTHFVQISTDKAVNISNVMGATKRMDEMIVQHFAAKDNDTIYTAVRFGNVLGSHGSVIPLSKRQYAAATMNQPMAKPQVRGLSRVAKTSSSCNRTKNTDLICGFSVEKAA